VCLTSFRIRHLLLAVALSALAACGSHGTDNSPPPPPVGNPKITCPANQTVVAPGSSIVVSYPPPVATDGSPPLATTCKPASGTSFPIGVNDVVCTTTDAVSRQATCTFQVTVQPAPLLKGTNFLAFGDSITAGEVTNPSYLLVVRPDLSYPTDLQKLMAARYFSQTVSVANCGLPEETAQDGVDRLESVLAGGPCGSALPAAGRTFGAGSFDALLLLEGLNDLNSGDPNSITLVRNALQSDVRNAKRAGVQQVFLSTLTPAFAFGGSMVPAMNDQIRSLAVSEGVVLVDAYAAFGGQSTTLIGVDGLHPTTEGYQVLAQTFFAQIQANFEAPLRSAGLRRVRR
jgi:lysophospholipase L1-like esterase